MFEKNVGENIKQRDAASQYANVTLDKNLKAMVQNKLKVKSYLLMTGKRFQVNPRQLIFIKATLERFKIKLDPPALDPFIQQKASDGFMLTECGNWPFELAPRPLLTAPEVPVKAIQASENNNGQQVATTTVNTQPLPAMIPALAPAKNLPQVAALAPLSEATLAVVVGAAGSPPSDTITESHPVVGRNSPVNTL